MGDCPHLKNQPVMAKRRIEKPQQDGNGITSYLIGTPDSVRLTRDTVYIEVAADPTPCDCSRVYVHAGLVLIGLAIVIVYFVDTKFNPFR